MKCLICGNEFKPKKKQKQAWFAVNWCSYKHGLLCPVCHAVAEELNAVSDEELAMCQMPWKSDIAKKSSAVSKPKQKELRASESLYKWLDEHPETPRHMHRALEDVARELEIKEASE
jgi:hypothetical protein